MPLESTTTIDGLVATNPDGASDPKSEGDNHLKLIKTVLKATFPGLDGRAFRTRSKSGNYTAAVTDNMAVLAFTASATLSFAAAATLGGWMALVFATSGDVTLDPDASEEINGATTLVVKSGEAAIVVCDGTEFLAMVVKTNMMYLNVEDQTLTGGVVITSKDLGTKSSGTLTPDPGDRPMQHVVNGGAFALAPSSNNGSCFLDIVNNSSAGAIDTSAFDAVVGDAFTTVDGDAFRCHISVGEAGTLLSIVAF